MNTYTVNVFAHFMFDPIKIDILSALALLVVRTARKETASMPK